MYLLKLNLPNLSQDAELELDGLGVFQNGHEYEIDNDRAEAFRLRHVFVDDNGTHQNGPTLLSYYKDSVGVDVSIKRATPEKKEPKKRAPRKAKATKAEGSES